MFSNIVIYEVKSGGQRAVLIICSWHDYLYIISSNCRRVGGNCVQPLIKYFRTESTVSVFERLHLMYNKGVAGEVLYRTEMNEG